jgi:hypothetical protein
MLSTIGGFIAALVALIAGLFGLSIGFAAVIAVMAPVLLIVMLPALLLVVLLRRLGIVRGRRASFVAMLLCIALLVGAIRGVWSYNLLNLPDWLDAQQILLDACGDQDQSHVTIEETDQGLQFSCQSRKADGPKRKRSAEGIEI